MSGWSPSSHGQRQALDASPTTAVRALPVAVRASPLVVVPILVCAFARHLEPLWKLSEHEVVHEQPERLAESLLYHEILCICQTKQSSDDNTAHLVGGRGGCGGGGGGGGSDIASSNSLRCGMKT